MFTQQRQEPQQTSLALRVWLYISKPFQITKVLELLYTFDWMWYAILSYLPSKDVGGSLFTTLRQYTTLPIISIIISSIALIHFIGLWLNLIWLRKINLFINILILTFISSQALTTANALPSGIGYLIVLIGITVFVFWRMDESH